MVTSLLSIFQLQPHVYQKGGISVDWNAVKRKYNHYHSFMTLFWANKWSIFLLCLFKFYSSFTLSSSSNIIFQWGLYLITQLITSTFCSYISPIIMPLYFSCLLKNCLGIVLHCMCNSKKYSQYAQRMNWLGCEIWQRSRTNWAVCLALVSSG